MDADTQAISNCSMCSCNKALHRPPAGLLQPLLIPSCPWSHIALTLYHHPYRNRPVLKSCTFFGPSQAPNYPRNHRHPCQPASSSCPASPSIFSETAGRNSFSRSGGHSAMSLGPLSVYPPGFTPDQWPGTAGQPGVGSTTEMTAVGFPHPTINQVRRYGFWPGTFHSRYKPKNSHPSTWDHSLLTALSIYWQISSSSLGSCASTPTFMSPSSSQFMTAP